MALPVLPPFPEVSKGRSAVSVRLAFLARLGQDAFRVQDASVRSGFPISPWFSLPLGSGPIFEDPIAMQTLARTLFFVSLTGIAFAVSFCSPSAPGGILRAETAPPERVIYLAHGLSDEALITLSATIAAQGKGVLLLDSSKLSPYLRAFLAAAPPTEVIPIGAYPDGIVDLEQRLNKRMPPVMTWTHGPPRELWRAVFPRAANVVVCPAQPRGMLLQAACLAGVLRAPLFVTHDDKDEKATLTDLLAEWQTRQVYLVGPSASLKAELRGLHVVRLPDEAAVAAMHCHHLSRKGPIHNLVVANPADTGPELGGMAALAPWVALQKRAALLLTGPDGKDADAIVQRAGNREDLARADTVIFVANLLAIPMQVRPNPIPADKDPQIEMEPLTPHGMQPVSFASGRLFHEDPAVIPLLLARQTLLQTDKPRKALVASNPGGSLSLLETFSRNTAQEFQNAGYDTTALFGKDVTPEDLRKLLTGADVFLWEGHHNTLIRDWEFPSWDEPLQPSLIFLQSCLALKDYKVHPLLSRGAIGVIGSSTRTYSGSGGACSLAFFNALLYEQQSLGGSLRQAKNFLLAYALLKEKRLGKEAQRTGANVRAAWAFTLWGDPTVKLPRPQPGESFLAPVRHEVNGHTIVVDLPEESHAAVKTEKYQIAMAPNARLAGLVRKQTSEDRHPLVPFVFAEVHLPRARPGQVPRLKSRLPSSHWVFCWDERRRCGYLLVTPRANDKKEIRFNVEWQAQTALGDPDSALGQTLAEPASPGR
jgi:hypothetical protein